MARSKVPEIVAEYKQGLEALLGPDLKEAILYGSHARGEGRDSSDIDVLCVMREAFDYGEMIRRTSELTASISLKHDVALSRVFVTESDYQKRGSPFLMNVRREGVRV